MGGPAPKSRTGLWVALAVVLVAALGGGGYYATAMRGPDPEMVKAQTAAAAAEEEKRKFQEEAQKLRAEKEAAEQRKAEEDARAKADQEARQKAAAEAATKRQLEDEARRKVEAENAEKKRADDEAQQKAAAEAATKRKAEEDARKAAELVAGQFDHFGKTLMLLTLRNNPAEIRLQGVDVVDDPGLRQAGVNALAAKPRNLRCRQTDRLTDGTPLYRCLITKLDAKDPLADIPDTDRVDLALALVRGGLVLASCDAPRAYADAEDEARGKSLNLWSMMKPAEYRRRCAR